MRNNLSEITTWTELKNEEQFCFGLESVMKIDNERMAHIRKDVTLSFGISYKILPQNLPFAEGLHRVKFSRVLVANKEHVAETAAAKLF